MVYGGYGAVGQRARLWLWRPWVRIPLSTLNFNYFMGHQLSRQSTGLLIQVSRVRAPSDSFYLSSRGGIGIRARLRIQSGFLGRGSSPLDQSRGLKILVSLVRFRFWALCANGSVVEHRLAKARAASSNLVSRFKKPCVSCTWFFCILKNNEISFIFII